VNPFNGAFTNSTDAKSRWNRAGLTQTAAIPMVNNGATRRRNSPVKKIGERITGFFGRDEHSASERAI
jgi:hypothetical protein